MSDQLPGQLSGQLSGQRRDARQIRLWTGMLAAALLLALCAEVSNGVHAQEQRDPGSIWLLEIEGAIGPATADYAQRRIEEAITDNAQLVILRLNTPGGLDLAMRSIIEAILSSPIPVAAFVSPSGARAASAGTYILYASHIAAMSPATNLGAATPVQTGGLPSSPAADDEAGDSDDSNGGAGQPATAMERKVINDAAAYIDGLAELRGRNREWAERAVREGVSLTATEALAENVIDLLARDTDDLLQSLDGHEVTINRTQHVLSTGDAELKQAQPDWRSNLLAVITNPNVAYILMLVGIYGLIFEFSNPGMGGPGIIGVVALLLALYAFQLLPISYLGLGLILLGVGLMAAEAFSPSFGILGAGGIIAFVIGSIVLMDTNLPAYQIALPVILAVAVASAGMLIFVLAMLLRSTRQQVVSGLDSLKGSTAEVERVHDGQPMVRLQGELWQTECDVPLEPGDRVRVLEASNLVLTVAKLEGSDGAEPA